MTDKGETPFLRCIYAQIVAFVAGKQSSYHCFQMHRFIFTVFKC